MSSSSLMILLLCVPIVGQTSVFLNATVGGSILIPCSLPVNSTSIIWFYWQEDRSNNILFHWHNNEKTQTAALEYRNRCQVFNTELSSGNISIRLNNVSVGDDQKTFWAIVGLYDEQEKVVNLLKHCISSLQVSAPYQDLNLNINNTVENATCTARGGYPEPEVSWTGQNKSSGEHLDLQDAQTSYHQHPTEKTFTVTSTVSIKELQSVTCRVYNPRSNQSIENTTVIDAHGDDLLRNRLTIGLPIGVVAAILLLVVYFLYIKCRDPNQRSQQAVNQGDLAANVVPADRNAPDASPNLSEGDVSEGNVSLDNQTGSCRLSVRRHTAADNASKKDTTAAAGTADTEATNLLSDSKEDSDETKSTESDKDK